MGKKYPEIEAKQVAFIEQQHIFFVGSATAESRINISPKGMDSLRVLGKNRVIWLNVTGSGNETAAHLQSSDRMTIMFCSFEEKAKILRLYGHASIIYPGQPQWDELYPMFEPLPGARQIFDMSVDLVHTSCGFGVPRFDFMAEREMLNAWALRKEQSGIANYWQERNSISLDGEAICFPDDK
ncbi:MAG: pyridoxamine 5'-phosphate oxidase family protein [Mariprofundus sp.]